MELGLLGAGIGAGAWARLGGRPNGRTRAPEGGGRGAVTVQGRDQGPVGGVRYLEGGVRAPRGGVRNAEVGSGGGTRPAGGGVLMQGFYGPDQVSWGGMGVRKRRSG